jgi:hypothetical protein
MLCLALPLTGSASASTAGFNWTETATKITGTGGSQLFNTRIGGFECSEASGEIAGVNTITRPAATLTAKSISYGGCHTAFSGAVVRMNGCAFAFHAGTIVEPLVKSEGTADISCGKLPIEVEAPFCIVRIGSQSGLGPISYTVQGKPKGIEVHALVTGIAYSYKGAGCGEGSGVDGTYTGTVVAKAYDSSGAQVGLWVE